MTDYTLTIVLRRKVERGSVFKTLHTLETTEYEDDEELCQALASQALEMLGEAREGDDE